MRVCLLYFGEVRIHEVAKKNLRVEGSLGVGQFHVRHAVDGSLLDYRESGPVVVNVGLQVAARGLRREVLRRMLLVNGFLL